MDLVNSCVGIVHGDIKPGNVLVFIDDSGGYTAKVVDFGYSTLAAGDDDLIMMPKSRPWNAPEHHHRGFKLSQAMAMDAYSFGLLCLWLLFNENEGYSENSLKALKSGDGIPGLA